MVRMTGYNRPVRILLNTLQMKCWLVKKLKKMKKLLNTMGNKNDRTLIKQAAIQIFKIMVD